MYDVTPVTNPHTTDCGATCLRMLLLYHGIDVPLERIVRECNTRLIGCSAADLLRVGRAHGLGMTAYKVDADELMQLDRPAIAHWRHAHWVVFCGMDDRGYAVIADPDKGRFGIDPGTFAALYSGVALFNGDPMDGIPAEDNYAVGQLFELGGTIYRATQAIARGECVRDGHNAEAVTVTEAINQINSESEE